MGKNQRNRQKPIPLSQFLKGHRNPPENQQVNDEAPAGPPAVGAQGHLPVFGAIKANNPAQVAEQEAEAINPPQREKAQDSTTSEASAGEQGEKAQGSSSTSETSDDARVNLGDCHFLHYQVKDDPVEKALYGHSRTESRFLSSFILYDCISVLTFCYLHQWKQTRMNTVPLKLALVLNLLIYKALWTIAFRDLNGRR